MNDYPNEWERGKLRIIVRRLQIEVRDEETGEVAPVPDDVVAIDVGVKGLDGSNRRFSIRVSLEAWVDSGLLFGPVLADRVTNFVLASGPFRDDEGLAKLLGREIRTRMDLEAVSDAGIVAVLDHNPTLGPVPL